MRPYTFTSDYRRKKERAFVNNPLFFLLAAHLKMKHHAKDEESPPTELFILLS